MIDMTIDSMEEVIYLSQKKKRGRLAIKEWQLRVRYVLRHLDDPIALQRSPLCRLAALERLAKAKYPDSVLARGRALRDIVIKCLAQIENELDGHAGILKLKAFTKLTREGRGVTESSRLLEISREYISRTLKRHLIELLAEKLMLELRSKITV